MPGSIRVRIVTDPGVQVPEYQTAGAAGVDLRANQMVNLAPLERKLIPTGIKVEIPEGFEAQVRPRSGMAIKHGLSVVNSPGTIDSDYRGEIQIIAINLGQEAIEIQKGDRIAQLVFCPIVRAEWEQVESLNQSNREEGGFGSTGRN